MTRQSKKLAVCPKCGWHDGFTHARECSPKAGALADKLVALFPNVKSTKLGYGFGRLTFQFDKQHSITLHVYRSGFSVDSIFWLGGLDTHGAELLIKGLAKILAIAKGFR